MDDEEVLMSDEDDKLSSEEVKDGEEIIDDCHFEDFADYHYDDHMYDHKYKPIVLSDEDN